MSLRPKLRALDVLLREDQYPLTLHVQESGPLVLQMVHPLDHTIQAPAKVAGGCATLLFRAPDLYITSYCAHPKGRALITHFTVADLTHCDANVYRSADGDLDVLQEILDWVDPHLLLTPAQVVVLTGDPLAEAPTWVSLQGFVDALGHIFLRSPSEASHSTEVRSDCSFPSDHLPVVTTLHGLPPAPQPLCPSKRGRFPIPRKPRQPTPHPQRHLLGRSAPATS